MFFAHVHRHGYLFIYGNRIAFTTRVYIHRIKILPYLNPKTFFLDNEGIYLLCLNKRRVVLYFGYYDSSGIVNHLRNITVNVRIFLDKSIMSLNWVATHQGD